MADNRCQGLFLKAQPLRAAAQISRRMVGVQVVDGALLLNADPTWAGAINTVLAKKGVRVNELRSVGDTLASDANEISTLGVPTPSNGLYGGCIDLHYVPSFANQGGIGTLNSCVAATLTERAKLTGNPTPRCPLRHEKRGA